MLRRCPRSLHADIARNLCPPLSTTTLPHTETLASAGFTSRTQQFQLTILVGAVKTLFTFVSTFKVSSTPDPSPARAAVGGGEVGVVAQAAVGRRSQP